MRLLKKLTATALLIGLMLFMTDLLVSRPGRAADDLDSLEVGMQTDGRIVVPTNQFLQPAGKQITFPGRPVDLALCADGKTVVIKNMHELLFLDPAQGTIVQSLKSPGLSAVGLLVQGPTIYVTSAGNELLVAVRQSDGRYRWSEPVKLREPKCGGEVYPTGIARLSGGEILVASNRGNTVQLIDPDGKQVTEEIGVGVAPYAVVSPRDDRVYVTNWGGNLPAPGSPQADSSGTPVSIDSRTGVANHGTVSVLARVEQSSGPNSKTREVCTTSSARVRQARSHARAVAVPALQSETDSALRGEEPAEGNRACGDKSAGKDGTASTTGADSGAPERHAHWQQLKTIDVGLHPGGMAVSSGGRYVYVANAASDSVSVIDAGSEKVIETIDCRPRDFMPFGSTSNALALSADGAVLYVANGTNNCLAVVRLGKSCAESAAKNLPEKSLLAGLIPTGWYPGCVTWSGTGTLCVANVKGCGSLNKARPVEKGRAVWDFLGSVSLIRVPEEKELLQFTKMVEANNRLAYCVSGLEKARVDAKPVSVPMRHGEPSVFKHVIYVIKENRTYDQVFGDLKEGNGDKHLVIFGEDVTPNQHKIAREFALFDNFYCSGVYSVDGHQWTNEAFVTDYLEKIFGRFVRSQPDDCWGTDPLAYSPAGFLWDNALLHKKTFVNFGEFAGSILKKPASWSDSYSDFLNHTKTVQVHTRANMETLVPYTRTDFPGWLLSVPDVARADIFIRALKEYEQKGELPNLIYLYLPCDHTSGTCPEMPTPKASVADNDLALGRVVDAVSHSRFWSDTVIFVVEDDPQDGFDHVDGHRTVAQAISAYTRRHFVDHTAYNQTGMVKTIELILGLPPMNQLDLAATPMRNCFQEKPDLTPFDCAPNKIALDELNPRQTALKGEALKWMEKSVQLDFSKPDLCSEDTLNRILWHSVRGGKAPYPEKFVSSYDDD